jgi:nucleotide-binding universal stress UspA family protein
LRAAAVSLYWIPLGADGHSVRLNGRIYEAVAAAIQGRSRCDLYHSALVVEFDGERYAIELAPFVNADGASRGVVATGPVGSRVAGRWPLFRYEVRCWRGGEIPDLAHAVGGACPVSTGRADARRVLELASSVPRLTWGRDEIAAGEMWNCNSVIAWLLASAGLATSTLRPPPGGRAPGWSAGLALALRAATLRVSTDRDGWWDPMPRATPSSRVMADPDEGVTMSQIIVGVDDTERAADAVALATALARTAGAELLIAHAYPVEAIPGRVLPPDRERPARERAAQVMERHLGATGEVPAQTVPLPGRSRAHELQRLADRTDAAAIVIGSSHRGELGRVLAGTTAERRAR